MSPIGPLAHVLVRFGLLAAPLLHGGCRTASQLGHERVEGARTILHADLGSMHNVSVSGELWIGSLPSPADLELAARRGIAAAIDLSTPEEKPSWDVGAACTRYAIEYVPIGIANRDRIQDEDVDRALAALRARAGRPVLLCCAHGDRSAMFFAIHRVIDDGLGLEPALVEARRAGMKPGHPEVFVRKQVERIAAEFAGGRAQAAQDTSGDIAFAIAMR